MQRAKSPPIKNIVSPQRISSANKRNAQVIYNILNQFMFKKKRYTFQILKQFFLFPEGSSSSVMSLEKYDKLIFNDEAIHTLVKKLETKVLERKLWAFLNIKLMRILKQVSNMSQKMKRVVKRKQSEHVIYGFDRIKLKAVEQVQKRKRIRVEIQRRSDQSESQSQGYGKNYQNYRSEVQTRDSASQTKTQQQTKSGSRISIGSQKVINETQQRSYVKMQPRVYVHQGLRSRSRSFSPANEFTRVIRQEQVNLYPQQYQGNVQIHQVTPKTVITNVPQTSHAKNYYELDLAKHEYRNCCRISPTIIRVVSCGCEHLLQKSCYCATRLNRMCGCNTCHHSCDGCDRCNCCHSHCSCQRSNRSMSKEKKTIKFVKSPSKKNIQPSALQNRNHYLNHLDSASPGPITFRYEYQQTRVTLIRR